MLLFGVIRYATLGWKGGRNPSGGAVELGRRWFDIALPVLAGEHTRRNRRQVAKGCKRVMEYMNAV
jgi:hypothetical protein